MLVSNDVRKEWLARYEGKTQKQAISSLKAYDDFCKVKFNNIEPELISTCRKDDQSLYMVLDGMVQFWIKDEKSPATIKNYFSFIRSYLRRYGIKTHPDDIRDYVKMPRRIKEKRSPFTKELIKRFLLSCNAKYKAFFLFLSCTGMRVDEGLNADRSWFDLGFYEKHGLVLVNIPAMPTKEKEERFTFLTPEAWLQIKPYVENRINDGKIFDFNYGSAAQYMKDKREELELNDRYSTGFHKISIHAFRSFTRTVLSDNSGHEFAYYILGQTGYLPTYYRKSPEEASILYKKSIPELTIGL